MPSCPELDLDNVILATYCALDDALAHAGLCARKGKLIARRGAAPDVDDREVLCLAMLQEMLGFESDNAFHRWMDCNPIIRTNFPRRLSRQNFADRRALLTPLIQKLCGVFAALDGESDPPFLSSTRTPSKSAASSEQVIRLGLEVWQKQPTTTPCVNFSTASANT